MPPSLPSKPDRLGSREGQPLGCRGTHRIELAQISINLQLSASRSPDKLDPVLVQLFLTSSSHISHYDSSPQLAEDSLATRSSLGSSDHPSSLAYSPRRSFLAVSPRARSSKAQRLRLLNRELRSLTLIILLRADPTRSPTAYAPLEKETDAGSLAHNKARALEFSSSYSLQQVRNVLGWCERRSQLS